MNNGFESLAVNENALLNEEVRGRNHITPSVWRDCIPRRDDKSQGPWVGQAPTHAVGTSVPQSLHQRSGEAEAPLLVIARFVGDSRLSTTCIALYPHGPKVMRIRLPRSAETSYRTSPTFRSSAPTNILSEAAFRRISCIGSRGDKS